MGHRWDRVAMDLLDMLVTTLKGNRYVLVMVDCLSRWTEACPLPNKMALAIADAFFSAYCLPVRNAVCYTFGSGPGVRKQSDARTVPVMQSSYDPNDSLPPGE